jgi:lipoyl-dependent peroxiredoxin
VAGKANVKLDDATDVTVKVGFGKDSGGGFGLTGDIVGYLPGLQQSVADDLMKQAHQVCPYSKATRGNVDVAVSSEV